MSKKFWLGLHSIFFAFMLISCASSQFEGEASLVGRVYDSEGRPVSGYHISAGLGLEAVSDKSGVFSIPNVSAGKLNMHGGANGWQAWEEEIEFYDRKEIVCIQVEKLEEMLPKIDFYLSEHRFDEARNLLSKSKKYNEKNPIFLSVHDLIDFCESPSEKRRQKFLSHLEKI